MVNGCEQLRIVDYKTGSDKTSVSSFDPVFDSANADNNGAILQMFVYCNFYAALQNYDGPIQPIIYKLRTLKTEGLKPIIIGSKKMQNQFTIIEILTTNFFHICMIH